MYWITQLSWVRTGNNFIVFKQPLASKLNCGEEVGGYIGQFICLMREDAQGNITFPNQAIDYIALPKPVKLVVHTPALLLTWVFFWDSFLMYKMHTVMKPIPYQESPTSRIWCLMIWGGADVIIIEIKCTINVGCLNHLKTITPPSPWKNCLPQNQSLVPKRLGPAA